MRTITYIIDKYLFTEYEDKLADAVHKSGNTVIFYDDMHSLNFTDFVTRKFNQDIMVIFHGSLQHGRQIAHLPIYPGIFLTIENYECFNYYGYFGEHLLNSDYIMCGLNDVLRHKDKYHGDIFIRPSNGYKTFTGQVLQRDHFEEQLNTLLKSYGGVEPGTLVLLAPAQKIAEEYRFIVIDGQVVSGATYFDATNIGTLNPHYDKLCTDMQATSFAVDMSQIYQPDKAFTIDVCKLEDGQYKLLELNSFNCASIYGNDYDKVVAALNELIIKEYNDMFDI